MNKLALFIDTKGIKVNDEQYLDWKVGGVLDITKIPKWYFNTVIELVNSTEDDVKLPLDGLCHYHSKGNRLAKVILTIKSGECYRIPISVYCDNIYKYCTWCNSWLRYNTELPNDISEIKEPWNYYILEE